MAGEAPIEHDPRWPVVSLADITTKIGSGATPKGGADAYLTTRASFALVRSQNVFDRRFDDEGLAYITNAQADRLRNVVLRPGDILLNITGDGITFGRACMVPTDILPACVNQHVSIVRVDPRRADAGFVLAFLTHPEVKQYIESFNAGGSRRAVTKGHIESFRLPLPPLPKQRAIAHILGTLDDKIELNRRMSETLEAMARALFKSWFVDFDPVRAKAEGRDPGLPKPLADLFPARLVDSELGEIPEGWEVKKLESLMTSHIGGGWGKEVPDDDHTEPAWVIRGTDIPGARGSQVAGIPHRFHTPSNLRSRRLAAGDIVFEVSGGSKGQPVGRTLFFTPQLMSAFDGDVICASFCKRICPDTSIYGAELLYLSFLEGYESGEIEQFQVQSTGISNFKWTEYITKTARVVPPESLRSRFREQVAPIFAEIATLGLQTQTLRRTRDLLLPRLLSGQIDVEAIDCA